MLLIRAREQCAACARPSQGRLADGRAVCIGCALGTAPAPIGIEHDAQALVDYNKRKALADEMVLALGKPAGVAARNVGTLAAGRELLRRKLTGNTAGRENRLAQYNAFATELIGVVRAQTAGAHGVSSSFASQPIDADRFANAVYALFMASSTTPDEDRGAWRAGHVVFTQHIGHSLVESLERSIGKFQARALLTDALGPFGTARDSRFGRLLPRVGDDIDGDDMLGDDIGVALTPPDTQELARRIDPLIESLTSRYINGDTRFSTMDSARAKLRQLFSAPSTRTKGRKQYDDFDEFAAAMVREISANSAIRDTKGAAAFATQPVVQEQFTGAVGGLFADWMGTKYSGVSAELIAKQAANMLFVALKQKLRSGRDAHDMLVAVFRPLAPRTGLRRYLPRIGDDIDDDGIDGDGYPTDHIDDDMLGDDIGGDIGLIHPDSDLIGAEAVAMVQQIDASLLRRARDALQKVTKGKRYDTVRLEAQLLNFFGQQMRTKSLEVDNNTVSLANDVVRYLQEQTIVDESMSNNNRKWAHFMLAIMARTFANTAVPAPATQCRQTQEDFVQKHNKNPDAYIIATELVNMAAFANKHAYTATPIAGGRLRDAANDTQTIEALMAIAEFKQVVQDMQRIRVSLIGQLNAVCAGTFAEKKTAALNGKQIVDKTLGALFRDIKQRTTGAAESS